MATDARKLIAKEYTQDFEDSEDIEYGADGFEVQNSFNSTGQETEDEDMPLWEQEDKETVVMPNDGLDEDMYGMTICSLVRDLYFMRRNEGSPVNRWSRLLTTIVLLVLCISIQIYLLKNVKRFVSAKAVHDIRDAYDKFEAAMYDTYEMSPNGKHRGLGEMKNASVFYELPDELQAEVCRIPLSQPKFFSTVLFVWSLTCLTELRKSKALFDNLILGVKTLDNMKYALAPDEEEDDKDMIVGLTFSVKGFICVLLLLRVGLTCFLLWLGCRWLLATNNFADLILNAVALEFILVLKELVYTALVPPRNQHDLSKTLIDTKHEEDSNLCNFVCTLLWAIAAAVWVVCYMGIPHHTEGWQAVLPSYRWDVHDVCEPWVVWRYCVSASCPKDAWEAYQQFQNGGDL